MNHHAFFNEKAYWSSGEYGCPCHSSLARASPGYDARVQRISECRCRHPSFTCPLPDQAELDAEYAQGAYKAQYQLDMQATWRHYAGVSYYDAEGVFDACQARCIRCARYAGCAEHRER
ncbi:hypothetical protein PMIN06_008209 [Paraphaeosphaeria minitans]